MELMLFQKELSPTARVMTFSFSLTTFTTQDFCKGVTLQQRTERHRFASSIKRSCRSGARAMVRVRPSITREMSGVVSTLRGSALYLLTSSRVQSRIEVQVICTRRVPLIYLSAKMGLIVSHFKVMILQHWFLRVND